MPAFMGAGILLEATPSGFRHRHSIRLLIKVAVSIPMVMPH
jgi:hypothetical protein